MLWCLVLPHKMVFVSNLRSPGRDIHAVHTPYVVRRSRKKDQIPEAERGK